MSYIFINVWFKLLGPDHFNLGYGAGGGGRPFALHVSKEKH
jgi:hypothetical protein